MQPGDTFLVDLGYGTHLHVVLSYPFGCENEHVVTMVATYTEDYQNSTCILRPSDGHSFITRVSYVAYEVTQILREEDLIALKAKAKPAFSEDVLSRILKGADANSSQMPMRYWKILDDQCLIPR
jgi:hypothetical protein